MDRNREVSTGKTCRKRSTFNSEGREGDDSEKYHHNTEQASSTKQHMMSTKNMMYIYIWIYSATVCIDVMGLKQRSCAIFLCELQKALPVLTISQLLQNLKKLS